MTIAQIQRKIAKIDDDASMTSRQIFDLGVIVDANMKPSMYKFHRLVTRGVLPATNISAGSKRAFYVVKGKDLKKFLNERFTK